MLELCLLGVEYGFGGLRLWGSELWEGSVALRFRRIVGKTLESATQGRLHCTGAEDTATKEKTT